MKLKTLAAGIITASLLSACSSSSNNDSNTTPSNNADAGPSKIVDIDLANAQKVFETNADIAYAAYSDAVKTAEDLKAALETFKNDTTQANLDAAKRAWLIAREPYGQTEVYRFRNSPIDSTDLEGAINAWPLGEALIDYVKTGNDFGTDQIGVQGNGVDVNSGGAIDAAYAAANRHENIIGNRDITINDSLLANSATQDDEHDVVSGYHAIEFLLWGQDLDNSGAVTDGTNRATAVKTYGAQNIATGGQRPLSDFRRHGMDMMPNHSAIRRHQYLEVAVDKLIADLKTVRDEWAPGSSYRTSFTTAANEQDVIEKVKGILRGMGTLTKGELAGERMKIAFVNNSQEDEHSCFSDNTHRDVWLNAEGVSNSYYGKYDGYDHDLDPSTPNTSTRKVDSGYGFDDYLQDAGTKAEAIKAKIEAALAETETNYKKLDTAARSGKPFDVLIQASERADAANPVRTTIVALSNQAIIIDELGAALLGLISVIDGSASECDVANPDTKDC